jgi:WD40 repeat protein
MRGHQNNVVDLSWSPDGSLIASASLDNLVIIWEVSSGQRLHTLKAREMRGVEGCRVEGRMESKGEAGGG